jgi:hypothetical protein
MVRLAVASHGSGRSPGSGTPRNVAKHDVAVTPGEAEQRYLKRVGFEWK